MIEKEIVLNDLKKGTLNPDILRELNKDKKSKKRIKQEDIERILRKYSPNYKLSKKELEEINNLEDITLIDLYVNLRLLLKNKKRYL